MSRAINYSLITASVILLVIFKLCYWKWEYLSGRNAGGFVPFAFAFGLICAVAVNYRLLTFRSTIDRAAFITLIAFDLILLALFTAPLPEGEMGAIEFTHGFRDLVQNSGEAPAIVAWARQISDDPKYEGVGYQPRFLRNYGAPDINPTKDKSVFLMWGGGFFHWGLFISSLGAEPPKSDKDSYYEKIDDGIYAVVPLR